VTRALVIGTAAQRRVSKLDVPTQRRVSARASRVGRVDGWELDVDGKALLHLLRQRTTSPRDVDVLVAALGAVAEAQGDVPLLSMGIYDKVAAFGDAEALALPDLLTRLREADEGLFVLAGPYLFDFPRVRVQLSTPLPLRGTSGHAVGYYRELRVAAYSLDEAVALVASAAGEDGGWVKESGIVTPHHPAWMPELPPLPTTSGIVAAGGRVYFGG
jgi:hypothetical protein